MSPTELFKIAWKDGAACHSCEYLYRYNQYHPYGEGVVSEIVSFCRLEETRDPDPMNCLFVTKKLQERKEDEQNNSD